MQEQLERDLKTALLAGDRTKVETLKVIKSALQYEAVAKSVKLGQLSDGQIQAVLARESKKRQEALDLYRNAGQIERADKEAAEKKIIDNYLPDQMDEAELRQIVETEAAKFEAPTKADMGKIIGAVRAKTAGAADGAMIAKLVKEKLEQN